MPHHSSWRRKIARRVLLAEATFCLLVARLVLILVPFPQLMRMITRPLRRDELHGPARVQQRKQVRQAIYTMRQRMQDQTTCLHRAIAAQFMLRRRGISSTIYFGAIRQPGEGLTTHAWVQDGTEGVVGYVTVQKARYHIVACYPPLPQPVPQSGVIHQSQGKADEQFRHA